jgi:hypothetical protein
MAMTETIKVSSENMELHDWICYFCHLASAQFSDKSDESGLINRNDIIKISFWSAEYAVTVLSTLFESIPIKGYIQN